MNWNKIITQIFILLFIILFLYGFISFTFSYRENYENADIKSKEREIESYLKQLNQENFSETDAASIKNSVMVIEPRLVQEKTKTVNMISSKETEINNSKLKLDKLIDETNEQIKIIEDENMKKKKTIQEDTNENINNMIQKNTDSSKRKIETLYSSEQSLKTKLDSINTDIKDKKKQKQELQIQKSDIKNELSKHIDFEPFTGMYEGLENTNEIQNKDKKEEDKKIIIDLMDKLNTLDNKISNIDVALSSSERKRNNTMKQLSELQGSINEQITSIQQETQTKNSEMRQQLNSAKDINIENIENSSQSRLNTFRFRIQDASKTHGMKVKESEKHIEESNEKIIRFNKILENIKIIKDRINDFLGTKDKYKRDDVPAVSLAEQQKQREVKVDGIINTMTPQCFQVDGIEFCPTQN